MVLNERWSLRHVLLYTADIHDILIRIILQQPYSVNGNWIISLFICAFTFCTDLDGSGSDWSDICMILQQQSCLLPFTKIFPLLLLHANIDIGQTTKHFTWWLHYSVKYKVPFIMINHLWVTVTFVISKTPDRINAIF